tara:strand:+ start:413 stop:595 length:183 start_codon:yes stop_codon:yes gene_type:complete
MEIKIVDVIEEKIYGINGFLIKISLVNKLKTPAEKFGEAKYFSYLDGILIIKNKSHEKVH